MTKRTPQLHRKEKVCLLALLLLPGISTGQNTQNPETQKAALEGRARATESSLISPAGPELAVSAQGVFYSAGQLRINVANSNLAEVLTKVAALTGAKIEMADGASTEQIPSLQLGPGPARQIVSSLLGDSNFDYVIQGFDAEPDKVQSVLLLPRGIKNNIPEPPTRPGRSQYARAAAAPPPPAEAPVPEAPVTAQDQTTANSVSAPPPQSDQVAAALPPPDLSAPPTFGQPLQTNVPPTFPVPPPATLSQQSVTQQLQQMYQQRMQMVQQEHQGVSPAVPANQ